MPTEGKPDRLSPQELKRLSEIFQDAGESLEDLSSQPPRSAHEEKVVEEPAPPPKNQVPQTVASEPDPCKSLGKYKLVRKIGEGGMGIVYEAMDTVLSRRVAVKVLKGLHLAPEIARIRFRREAQAAGRLNHPNLIPVFDYGSDGDDVYIAMPLIHGRSLNRVLEDPAVSMRDRLVILEKVVRALEHAHRQGVVHRDVKPDNILVDDQGEPHVGDFGLALLQNGATQITASGAVLGTPMYMAPEQVRGCGDSDARTDVFALGVILYQIVVGAHPHQGKSLHDLYAAILFQEPTSPREVNARIHADIETICLKALEKDPRRRYGSAGAFADDLRSYLAGEPIAARPPSWGRIFSRHLRRHPAWTSAAAVVVICATGILVWAGISSLRSRREMTRLFRQGQAAYDEGRYEESGGFLRRYLESRPEDLTARALHEDCARKLWDRERDVLEREQEAGNALGKAKELRHQGNWTDDIRKEHEGHVAHGLSQVELALGLNPGNSRAWLIRGRLEREGYRLEKAFDSFSRVLGIDPTSAAALYERGFVALHVFTLLTMERSWSVERAEAKTWYQRALDDLNHLRPESLTRGEALYLDHFQRYSQDRLDPESLPTDCRDPWILGLYALQLEARGRFGSALNLWERAASLLPGDPLLLCQRAWCRLNGTSVFFDRCALVAHILFPSGWLDDRLCMLLQFRPRFKGIQKEFDQVLQVWSAFPQALTGRAWARGFTFDFRGGIADLNDALELAPEISSSHVMRGAFLSYDGRPLEALAEFDHVLKEFPEHEFALDGRVQALQSLGRADEARQTLRRLEDVKRARARKRNP